MTMKCDEDIYANGQVLMVCDTTEISAEDVEKIAVESSERAGFKIDWHYFAGRTVFKTLGDWGIAYEALNQQGQEKQ